MASNKLLKYQVNNLKYFNTMKQVIEYCRSDYDCHTWEVRKLNKLTNWYDSYKTLNKTLISSN